MNARLKSVLTDIEGYADDAHPAAAVAASLKATRMGRTSVSPSIATAGF